MHKVVVNPTWRCQFRCPYCWVIAVGFRDNPGRELPWQEWVAALTKHIPKGSIIDFSGGEPLLFKGFYPMLNWLLRKREDLNWAVTTNLASDEWELFYSDPLPRCAVINVSSHPESSQEVQARAAMLTQRYPLRVNWVVHPSSEKPDVEREWLNEITYEDWEGGNAVDGVPRYCNAGEKHWFIDPQGYIFNCSIEPRLGVVPSGNIFTGKFPKGGERLCKVGCGTCYTDNPSNWLVTMREVEAHPC